MPKKILLETTIYTNLKKLSYSIKIYEKIKCLYYWCWQNISQTFGCI